MLFVQININILVEKIAIFQNLLLGEPTLLLYRLIFLLGVRILLLDRKIILLSMLIDFTLLI